MSSRHRTALVRSLLGAGLAAVLTGGLLVVAPTSQADVRAGHDRARDVEGYTIDERGEDDVPDSLPTPDREDGDITRFRTVHTRHRVTIRAWYRDLATTSDYRQDRLRIVTSEGLRLYAYVESRPGSWAGRHFLLDSEDRLVRCAVRHATSYRRNTLVLSVPRRCLGHPRWVRLGFGMWMSTDGDDGSSFTVHGDDARRRGVPGTMWDVVLGGRIHRD